MMISIEIQYRVLYFLQTTTMMMMTMKTMMPQMTTTKTTMMTTIIWKDFSTTSSEVNRIQTFVSIYENHNFFN